jgi:hypothetical protein
VDWKDKRVYWTDSSFRGRWNGLHTTASHEERIWKNNRLISNAAIMPGVAHLALLSSGKIDGFRVSKYDEEGPPSAGMSMSIEVPSEEQTTGKWELLVPDLERESMWAGNDEGLLVEVSVDDSGVHQDSIIKLRGGSYKFSTAGVVIGKSLALLDTANLDRSRVVIVELAANCLLGPQILCKCRASAESKKQQQCTVSSTNLHGLIDVPARVTAFFPKDVTIDSGATVVMALSARLEVTGGLTIGDGVTLVVSDSRRRIPLGANAIVEAASVTGAFASVRMERSMQVSRIFYCAQFPKLRLVATGTGMKVHFSVIGPYCISPLLTMPLLFAALGALLYWRIFKGHVEKLEYKQR